MSTYQCSDKMEKEYALTFDGGSFGNYTVILCRSCYQEQNKRFLISEKGLEVTSN